MSSLKIIVPENFREFGEKVNKHLNEIRKEEEPESFIKEENYITSLDNIRFNNGEGKCVIRETVRDKDVYILADVSNDSITYNLRGKTHNMSPDEHLMDILRILSSECGHATKRTLIMPYLYGSRQDRRDARESLDCAMALDWLSHMGIDEFVTCDVHNKGVTNAVHKTPFENMYLTDTLLADWAIKERITDFQNVICVSPDEGAMKRARFFSEVLDGAQVASFYKYRSPKILDGSAQIREHRFLGNTEEIKDKIAIITDDMIDTGNSILDSAKQLKELGVDKVYLMTTFAFFSKGVDKFNEYYMNGYIEKVYATNLVYVSPEIIKEPWFELVDCSKNIAQIINELNRGRSISEIIKGRDDVLRRVRTLKERGRKWTEKDLP